MTAYTRTYIPTYTRTYEQRTAPRTVTPSHPLRTNPSFLPRTTTDRDVPTIHYENPSQRGAAWCGAEVVGVYTQARLTCAACQSLFRAGLEGRTDS